MPLKTHLDEQPTLNLTSMIDIVFLLIIFFMVGTEFTDMERKIPLQVPEVADEGTLTAAPQRRIVNVYRDGRVTLDDAEMTLGELTATLAAICRQYDDLAILVRGDGRGDYQRVAEVLTACKRAGVKRLEIAVLSKR